MTATQESEIVVAGTTQPINADLNEKLINFALWMKREGYAEVTITTRVKLLRILAKRGANLNDVDSVKDAISRQRWTEKRKVNAADAYSAYLRMVGGTWTPPRYQVAETLPFIPMEQELDDLIAACGPKTSTFLQLLKETGMRAGEANRLKWTDIDTQSNTIRVTPEKGSKPRIFRLSNALMNRLSSLGKDSSNLVFNTTLRTRRRLFQKQRATLARKLGNPRLLEIHFHTFRHWKATHLYHQTKDILHVMRTLGHRNIKNTLLYVQLEEALYADEGEYICKAATTVDEAKTLIEGGFTYVCEVDGTQLFKRRK